MESYGIVANGWLIGALIVGIHLAPAGGTGLGFAVAYGQDTIRSEDYDDDDFAQADGRGASFFQPPLAPHKPRNYLLPPIVSFFLPGFDQWWEGQYWAAASYTGIGLAGAEFANFHKKRLLDFAASDEYQLLSEEEKENRLLHGETERKYALGNQVVLAMGSFSAYHSFRTAVTTQQRYGKFTFLRHEETPWDLVKAPFQFRYLARANTFIPLGIIAGISLFAATTDYSAEDDVEKDPLSRADVFYTGATSFLAGTHEEALFRGYLMPVVMEWTSSPFWSNTVTSLIFAAAHLNTVDVPVAQLLLGWHLGNVTIDNDWQLSESIFIHTWWDVFALLSAYQIRRKVPDAKLPVIWLPPLELRF